MSRPLRRPLQRPRPSVTPRLNPSGAVAARTTPRPLLEPKPEQGRSRAWLLREPAVWRETARTEQGRSECPEGWVGGRTGGWRGGGVDGRVGGRLAGNFVDMSREALTADTCSLSCLRMLCGHPHLLVTLTVTGVGSAKRLTGFTQLHTECGLGRLPPVCALPLGHLPAAGRGLVPAGVTVPVPLSHLQTPMADLRRPGQPTRHNLKDRKGFLSIFKGSLRFQKEMIPSG